MSDRFSSLDRMTVGQLAQGFLDAQARYQRATNTETSLLSSNKTLLVSGAISSTTAVGMNVAVHATDEESLTSLRHLVVAGFSAAGVWLVCRRPWVRAKKDRQVMRRITSEDQSSKEPITEALVAGSPGERVVAVREAVMNEYALALMEKADNSAYTDDYGPDLEHASNLAVSVLAQQQSGPSGAGGLER